jgi:methylenetetrahydrofolate dehydrogenase (NADP+)/methenyltetrahydrofolate cyclohydrolase
MAAIVFDGKVFAQKIEEEVARKVAGMERKPKLVTIYGPEDMGSRVYTKIKANKAEELGIQFEEIQVKNRTNSELRDEISKLNKDKTVDGIMVQVPIEGQDDLIKLIDPKKDVDGLREDSQFIPATVRAVMAILKVAENNTPLRPPLASRGGIAVVGSRGQVGMRLMAQLAVDGYTVWGMDIEDFDPGIILKSDVIISCTGKAGLIKPEMVKEGAVCIDVGYPKGDFDPSTVLGVGFFTPVPGGVGPVTVATLFSNLVKLGYE